LDRDTSGLLLLTNDGEFANRIAHPRYEVAKTYVAEVRGNAKRSHVTALVTGVELDDGRARADRAAVKASRGGRSVVELDVREGRNRLVRRMLEAVGLPVTALVRTAVGPVRLGRLRAGTFRTLERSEVLAVLRAAQSVD
jgi:23S rRNA pseudouridine2605 synthase